MAIISVLSKQRLFNYSTMADFTIIIANEIETKLRYIINSSDVEIYHDLAMNPNFKKSAA